MRRIEQLQDASATVLACRDLGHAWQWFNDDVLVTSRGLVDQFTSTHICQRCAAERRRKISAPSWAIESTTMRYPDDYLAAKGSQFTKADVRGEYVRRHMEGRNA